MLLAEHGSAEHPRVMDHGALASQLIDLDESDTGWTVGCPILQASTAV